MVEKDANYYRLLAEKYKQNYEASREELEEFQSGSRELERELETQLEQAEARNHSLTSDNERLCRERDDLRERLEGEQTEWRRRVGRLEEELASVTLQRDTLQRLIRELEQANDDLERAKRNVSAVLDDLERRLNDTLERNAILESELDDKDNLQTHLQRLKEETRDLRQELRVKEVAPTAASSSGSVVRVDTPERMDTTSATTTPDTPNGPPLPSFAAVFDPPPLPSVDVRNSTPPRGLPRSKTVDLSAAAAGARGQTPPLTPSTRISALNIVGDLLRKVGALENKLASCRKYSSDERNGGPEPKQPHLSVSSTTHKSSSKSKHK